MFDTFPIITARQAVPGTEVLIESSITTDFGARPHFEFIVVDHWVPCGEGLAGLVSKRGQWCGKYPADHEFKVRAR